jgi:hypothetical protein
MLEKKPLILVCCHKNTKIYQNDIIKGILLNSALQTTNNFYPLKDNTGDNISIKNNNYCELTALYWAAKNIKETEYSHIGIFHYRRYLSFRSFNLFQKITPFNFLNEYLFALQEKNIKNLLSKYDIILPKKIDLNRLHKNTTEQNTMRTNLYKEYNKELLDLSFSIMLDKFPKYKTALNKTMDYNKLYFKNIFIMKTNLFIEYSNFLFTIFFTLEQKLKQKQYKHLTFPRIYGYLSERFLNIFLTYKQLEYQDKHQPLRILERDLIIKRTLILNKESIQKIYKKLKTSFSNSYFNYLYQKIFQ